MHLHIWKLFCSVLLKLSSNVNLIAVCTYRPPRADVTYQTNSCNYITDIVDKYPEETVCCYGDFNLPDIDWENGSVVSHILLYILLNYNNSLLAK